jgi:hypothetical protein
MKQKMLQLMLVFLTISLFSSSKENASVSKCKCNHELNMQESETLKMGVSKKTEEYPLILLPGNNLLIY